MLEVLYYPEGDRGPVRVYLDWLARERPKAFTRLAADLETLGSEGLRSSRVIIRPFEKKSAKTPKEDLDLARRRLREVTVL